MAEAGKIEVDVEAGYSIRNMILYKLDRTLAIAGLVAIGVYSLYKGSLDDQPIALAVIGALGVYIGGRGLNK